MALSDEIRPHREPFDLFREMYDEAHGTDVVYPNSMVLATVDASGQPSSRVVLLKSFDEHGFVFYTNFESRKGREILANPKVSLTFYWRELGRQVTVLGTAEQVADEEADAYYATRPRGSQLGAWVSKQSRPLIGGRGHLLAEVARLEAHYLGGKIPRPPHWSGFRVVPHWIEIWVEGKFRLHDRTAYERVPEGWKVTKLYP